MDNPYGTDGAFTFANGVDETSVLAQIGRTYSVQCRLDTDGKSVYGGRTLENRQTVYFSAKEIHKTAQGALVARVEIRLNDWPILAWGTINIERTEERGRLVKEAYDKLDNISTEHYTYELMFHDFHQWCYWIWPTVTAGLITEDSVAEGRPVRFLTHPYIIEGGGTILFGDPGGGKSYISLLMSISMDAGYGALFPVDPKPHKVMYVNLERGPNSIKHRIATCNQVLGFERDRPLLQVNQTGQTMDSLKDQLKKAVETLGVEVVVLDSISRATSGKSMIDDTTGNMVVDTLNGLCPTWLAIAHNSKGNKKSIYGSYMFEAGADVVVHLNSQPELHKIGVSAEIVKANDIGRHPKRFIALEFSEYGLTGLRGAEPGEFPDLEVEVKTGR